MGLIARDESLTFFTDVNDESQWVRNRQIQNSHCLSLLFPQRFAYFPRHALESTRKRQTVDFYLKLTPRWSKLDRP